jgi:hypothetical protein
MSKLETNTIDNISGSSTLTIGDSNTSTITLKSGATLTNFPDNTPAFHAFLSADQGSLSDAATVKIQVNSETYDSDGTYDNSTNYRFTPGVAGKYFLYGAALISSGATANLREAELYIYKNGSSIGKSTFNYVDQYSQVATPMLNIVDVANTTDYYELYAVDQGPLLLVNLERLLIFLQVAQLQTLAHKQDLVELTLQLFLQKCQVHKPYHTTLQQK